VTTPPPVDISEFLKQRPPPPGYGAQVTSQGGIEIGRNLICHKCHALVPDDAFSVKTHDAYHHAEQLVRESMDTMIDEMNKLKARYTIQEEP